MTFRKVIAGVDGGVRTPDVLRFAAVVAQATHAELIVAHVYHYDPPFDSSDQRIARRADAMRLLCDAERALPYGSRASVRAVESRSPVLGLHDLAASENADLIVVGDTTRGAIERHAVGRVPERLLHHAPCAVAVAPRGYAREENPALRVIGVAYDGSPESEQALATAAALALASGGTLKLIGVAEHKPPPVVGLTTMYSPPQSEGAYGDSTLRRLEEAAASLPEELRTQIVAVSGDPAAALTERAEILSLLVMGSRGYGPVRRALLGSVSGPLLRRLPCPVLVVPRGVREVVAGGASA